MMKKSRSRRRRQTHGRTRPRNNHHLEVVTPDGKSAGAGAETEDRADHLAEVRLAEARRRLSMEYGGGK